MKAARVDASQSSIVAALRGAGCFVQSLARMGGGVPDLLVAHAGKWLVLECKDGDKPPSARRLTPEQQRWVGAAVKHAPVYIVENVAQALKAVTP